MLKSPIAPFLEDANIQSLFNLRLQARLIVLNNGDPKLERLSGYDGGAMEPA